MGLHIQLDPAAQSILEKAFGTELPQAALEGLVLEGYRAGRISIGMAGRLLGHDNRWQTEEWLSARGAQHEYRPEDLEADLRVIDALRGSGK